MTRRLQTESDNYALWHTPQYTQKQFAALSARAQLEYLCGLGHLAPSSHNTQPWRFYIDEKKFTITVLVDRTAILPESDPTGRQALISIGCSVGNLVESASCYKLAARIVYGSIAPTSVTPLSSKTAKARYTTLAKITFAKFRTAASFKTVQAIFSRKVVRAEFDVTKRVPAAVLRKAAQFGSGKDIRLFFMDKSVDRLKVSELQQQADGFVANSPKFAKELGAWVLPNDSRSYLGMPGSNFGMTQVGSERLHRGLLGKGKLQADDMLKFSLGSKFLIERSAALGFLFGKADTPLDWLKTGTLATKLFLWFEMNKISISIHAGLTEVGLVHDIFTNTFAQSGKLLMVFRIGYIKRKEDLERPHSPRLPLGQVLLK